MTGTYKDQSREDNGRFGGALRPEADAGLPPLSLTARAGGVVSAWYGEKHMAIYATTADLSQKQRDALRDVRDELDAHVGETARSRMFDVHTRDSEPTIVYVWPKYDLKSYETWCVRAEITEDGTVLEHNIARFDQYGPIWFRKDPVEPGMESDDAVEDVFGWIRDGDAEECELDEPSYVWTWIK